MKKFGIVAITVILTLSLAACGRNKDKETTTPTNDTNTSAPTILDPTIMDPTLDTNIPDPSVDTSMPDLLDPTNSANTTTNTETTK